MIARLVASIAVAASINSVPAPHGTKAAIEAPGPFGALKATLLSPEKRVGPVVLIVPGSGPTDRNGNGPNGLQSATYRLLAYGLRGRGIATVRIDKRGMYGSALAIPNADDVTLDDYATDVHSWVSAIRERTGVSCVWVLGHSEGGLVALVAAQHTPNICGLILLSTAGRPFGMLLREQLRSNPANAPILNNAMSILDALEAGKTVDATNIAPALMPLFSPKVQRFLMSELTVDPAVLLANYSKPVLIVQGLRDLQIAAVDAQLLKHADPNAELVLVANANHVLKAVHASDRGANLATYSDPDLPLADGIVKSISAFVWKSTTRRP